MRAGEANSAATLRIAQSWLGGVVDAAKQARPGIKPYLYSAYAKYDHGFQLTTWPMLKSMVRKCSFCDILYYIRNRIFSKTGSGQTLGKLKKRPFLQGFGSTPSYYQLMNSLDSLAEFTRAERLAIGNR